MSTQITSNQIQFAYLPLSGPNQKNYFALGHSVQVQSTHLKSQNYLFKWPRLKCDCIVSENTNVQVF